MSHEVISNWLEKAKMAGDAMPAGGGVRVIRREEPRSKGSVIMEIADKLRPFLTKMFDGVRDENDMLVQPAHIRGIALNLAQRIIREEENA